MSEEGEIARRFECDVLVIGSGVSGYCAAIQAGRLGCRTILLEKDEVLGGNSGPNLGVGITGADRYNHYGAETGIIHETQEEGAWVQGFTQTIAGQMPYNISRRYEAVIQQYLEEAGVLVLKRHYARRPIVSEDRAIRAVLVEDLAAFQTVQIDVKHVVIEASGDGEIGALAGADFDVGSEAQSECGERSAPAVRTNRVQGTSLVAIAQKTDHEVVYIPPPGVGQQIPRVWEGRISSWLYHHDRWLSDLPEGVKFLYLTEAGGGLDTIRDDGQIYEALLRQLWAEWDHIKNGPHREDAKNWDLLWVSPKAGKRESRRFLGDAIVTQTDAEAGRLFEDDIAYSGHDLDDHKPLGEGGNIFSHSVPPMFGIPYRACYSRNVPNLLLAGRLISATHIAHSSTRLMRTGGAIGQAVGYAAALCCKYACTPRAVYIEHLEELRDGLLAADATILGRPLSPQGDLARQATMTASSELRFNDQIPGELFPLIAQAAAVLWDWPPSLAQVEVYLRNPTEQPQPLILRVYRARHDRKWKFMEEFERFGRNDLRDSAFAELASVPVVVPAGHEGWFAITFSQPLVIGARDAVWDDDRLVLALDENEAVQWALAQRECLIAEMVEHSHFSPEWRPLKCTGTLRLSPAPSLGEAANVINGFQRRFSRGPLNMWISDPQDGLPQDLLLSWSDPQAFDEVCLTFDNLARLRHEQPWECGQRVLPILVESYELAAWQDGAWRTLAAVSGNYHRFRRHRFPSVTADRLRLRVLATHGGPAAAGARVYEVQVYHRRP
jgi:hypothetical protein